MAFKRRRDGVYIKDLDPFKRLFPYVMEGRNNSVVYTIQRVDASNLLGFIERHNEGRGEGEKVGLFHVFLAVIARTFFLRPELNRFIVGKRFYQHKDIGITFVAKKEYTEEAPESEVRMVFTGKETLEEIRDMVTRRLSVARSDHKGDDDKLMELVAALPRPLVSLIVALVKWLDYHNILPAFLMDAIPLYTSIYLANLGSIGLGAPFHHLFEMGSASSFLTIGKIEKQPVVDEAGAVVARDCIEFAFAFDERVSEGFNHIRSIQVFQNLLTHPELLVTRETSIDRILEAGGGLHLPVPLADRLALAEGAGAGLAEGAAARAPRPKR
ncbi:MAG: 2-oxo acid dehydrogenase subunit E2 [Treponema sp.]|nr:2-oxo acid dehydrogenase subunit E2 [Treponema sp.]